MTHALVFDTESTGLPLYGKAHPAHAQEQPRMCSISMALIEEETGDIVDRMDAWVKPDGWPLDNTAFRVAMEEAVKIHGLTLSMLQEAGIPITDIHPIWKEMYAEADYVCAFNIMHDHKIIRGEWKRLGEPIPFRDKKWFCLMHAAAKILKPGYKMIKAKVACEKLLGRPHLDNHNSLDDLNFNLDLFRYLRDHRAIELEDQPEAKDAEAQAS